jgi:hypothetical protein
LGAKSIYGIANAWRGSGTVAEAGNPAGSERPGAATVDVRKYVGGLPAALVESSVGAWGRSAALVQPAAARGACLPPYFSPAPASAPNLPRRILSINERRPALRDKLGRRASPGPYLPRLILSINERRPALRCKLGRRASLGPYLPRRILFINERRMALRCKLCRRSARGPYLSPRILSVNKRRPGLRCTLCRRASLGPYLPRRILFINERRPALRFKFGRRASWRGLLHRRAWHFYSSVKYIVLKAVPAGG